VASFRKKSLFVPKGELVIGLRGSVLVARRGRIGIWLDFAGFSKIAGRNAAVTPIEDADGRERDDLGSLAGLIRYDRHRPVLKFIRHDRVLDVDVVQVSRRGHLADKV